MIEWVPEDSDVLLKCLSEAFLIGICGSGRSRISESSWWCVGDVSSTVCENLDRGIICRGSPGESELRGNLKPFRLLKFSVEPTVLYEVSKHRVIRPKDSKNCSYSGAKELTALQKVLSGRYVPGLSSKIFVIHGVGELFEERESRRDLGLCSGGLK